MSHAGVVQSFTSKLYNSNKSQSIKIESFKKDNDHNNVNAFFELTWLHKHVPQVDSERHALTTKIHR